MHSPVGMGPWPHDPETLSLHWCVLRTGDAAHVPTRESGPGDPKTLGLNCCLLRAGGAAHVPCRRAWTRGTQPGGLGANGPVSLLAQTLSPYP